MPYVHIDVYLNGMQELAITSDEGLSLEEFPKRVVIVGGGYVVMVL